MDPRQISIDIIIDYIPSGFHNYIQGNQFYRCAIPAVNSTGPNGQLHSSWETEMSIIRGRICELSDPLFIKDIQSFVCANEKCRNSNKVIRFVGFDFHEQPSEIAAIESAVETSQVFKPANEGLLRCSTCREPVHELPSFRSHLQFRIAAIKTESPFTVEIVICGETGDHVRIGMSGSFFGFAAKTFELPFELRFLCAHMKSFYFEAYGFAVDDSGPRAAKPLSVSPVLSAIPDLHCLIELLYFQAVGNANDIIFDIILVGLDEEIIRKLLYASKLATSLEVNTTRKIRLPQQKEVIKCNASPWGKLVRFCTALKRAQPSSGALLCCTDDNPDAFLPHTSCPIVIFAEIEPDTICDLLLEDWGDDGDSAISACVPVAAGKQPAEFDLPAVKLLQEHFVHIRRQFDAEAVHLQVLSKLARISAIINGRSCCSIEDAEKAISLFDWCLNTTKPASSGANHCLTDSILSPSISFNSSFNFC